MLAEAAQRVTYAQNQSKEQLSDRFKQINDPAPMTAVGLSNISNGCMKNMRSLVNRTYLVMALTCGLDSAITDPFDTDLVEAMITTELLMCRSIYADDFIKAYRASQ